MRPEDRESLVTALVTGDRTAGRNDALDIYVTR
jgi:hypothetical protein